jgi:hypothetical protein
MNGRMHRLVCVALIALLSGTPAFAAMCAEACGLKTASVSTPDHCSKRGTAVAAIAVGHAADCCERPAAAVAEAATVWRLYAISGSLVAPSGPYVPMPLAPDGRRALPPGSSGPPALSRAPVVLRI